MIFCKPSDSIRYGNSSANSSRVGLWSCLGLEPEPEEPSVPLNTRVTQRACISARGLMAPRAWMKPTTASVGLDIPGGNTWR